MYIPVYVYYNTCCVRQFGVYIECTVVYRPLYIHGHAWFIYFRILRCVLIDLRTVHIYTCTCIIMTLPLILSCSHGRLNCAVVGFGWFTHWMNEYVSVPFSTTYDVVVTATPNVGLVAYSYTILPPPTPLNIHSLLQEKLCISSGKLSIIVDLLVYEMHL